MKKIFLILFLMAISLAVFIFSWKNKDHGANLEIETDQLISEDASVQNETDDSEQDISIDSDFQAPLAGAEERINKKPFGIFITVKNSPVQPERFEGYHTGADFEIFSEELNIDVPVKAVCSGKLLLKRYVGGYGGVAIEECLIEGSPVSIIYGHLKLESINFKVGDKINAGEEIGILGEDKSGETDGERKHLHLGLHKGATINLKGYVSNKADLDNWFDPCDYVCL